MPRPSPPKSGDHPRSGVTLGSGDSVSVAAAASAGSLSIGNTATITFSGSATLAVAGAVDSTGGTATWRLVVGPAWGTVAPIQA